MASGKFGTGNLCTWIYEDHGADREYLNSPLLHVNPKGYVDVYRIPKYAYYFWQAAYYKSPMAFIQPHYWRSQYLGQKKDIVVNSNCEKVELKVNGISKGIQVPDDANFHCVTFKDITVEKGTLSVTGTKAGKTINSQVIMADEPAKIILKSNELKITADRGSVLIITADITDSKGNHMYGASNNIKWNVTGPAVLVGPSVYESDINKHHEMEGVWYMDMPVSNVIRSTGKAGKIHISASASGLTSGAIDIIAEVKAPDNTVINEPVLSDEGRKAVDRIELKVNTLEEIPQEIKTSYDELSLAPSDKRGYAKTIKETILRNNSSIDTASVEFKTLVDLFASQLSNSNGRLIADDYNFSVTHYNNCRLIAGYIAATKLPQPFKDGLRKYYSNSIIKLGSEKNAGDEMNWLNWIPSGGTVVISQDTPGPAGMKGIIYTKKNELSDLIAVVYPQFVNFSTDAKERALIFISKANPYIHINSVSEQSREGNKEKITKISYLAEKGHPILIPLVKFISE
jgi:beta-galactosidase